MEKPSKEGFFYVPKIALTRIAAPFKFGSMYNRKNHLKRVRAIIAVYNAHKTPDIPDSKIVRVIFPQNNIYISYRTWMEYKGMSFPKEETQLSLF